MTDKVQRIKGWISKTQDGLMDAQGNFEYPEHEVAYHILCDLDTYIDSLSEEPVSEDLEKTSKEYADKNYVEWLDFVSGDERDDHYPISEAFKAGAQWQKRRLIEKACEFFENDLCCYIGAQHFFIQHKRLEEDFKKAMEESA